MKNFFTEIKQDGSLYTLKYMLIGIVVFSIIGASFGLAKVSFFEQSPSGRYAVYEACDDEYASYAPDEPCDVFKMSVTPLGKRLKDQAKFYAIIFGGIGVGFGIIYGDYRWNNKKRKKLK